MVERIYDTKNMILDRIWRDLQERGIDRIDMNEMGMLVDMVKDLSEAEEKCWEAEYYQAVSEGMKGKAGYSRDGMGYQGRDMRYQRSGYQSGHQGVIDSVRDAMMGMKPDERERMREQLMSVMER